MKEWLDYLERGEDNKTRKPKTILDYRVQTNFWCDHFNGYLVSEITRKNLAKFFTERKGGARLKNLNLVLWRAFSKWCLDEDRQYIEKDPTRKLGREDEPTRKGRGLTIDEVGRLLRACRESYKVEDIKGKRNSVGIEGGASKEVEESWSQKFCPPPELEGIVLLALTSLLRLGNCLSLTWGDLDLEADVLRLPGERMKNNQDLEIPLSRSFKNWIVEKAPKGKEEDRIFGVTEIKKPFGSALKRAKIKGRTFHSLRKSGVNFLRERRVPVEVVMALGGWSRKGSVMLSHYRQPELRELKEAVRLLDDLVEGKFSSGSNTTSEKANTVESA